MSDNRNLARRLLIVGSLMVGGSAACGGEALVHGS